MGLYTSPGLPNIEGVARLAGNTGLVWLEDNNTTGAFTKDGVGSSWFIESKNEPQTGFQGLKIDASHSSNIYGNSTTVQPCSLYITYVIKYNI